MKLNLKEIVENLIDNFLEAGDLAIQLREKGLVKKIKSDNTPVSNGDLEVNKFISKKISEVTPNLPIISEETSENKDSQNLKDFWLVDPIDGTYDYINNLEEFTINAGLIINNKPVAGLINAPAKKRMFYSYGENQAFELINILDSLYVDNAELYALWGDMYYATNEKSLSLKYYKLSIKIKQSIKPVWTQILFIDVEQANYDSLLIYSEKAILYYPTEPLYYYFYWLSDTRYCNLL